MPLDGQDGRSGPNPPEPVEIDLRLVTLAAAGDRDAFEELYRRHAPLARRVAWSVLHDDGDADDAVAEAFERLLRVLPADRLHDRRAFRGYLLVTTRNLALDAVRRRSRAGGWDDALEELVTTDAFDGAAVEEEAGFVRRAFAGLPERWRTVLWLTEVEALPHVAAAGLLGVSTNAVTQLAARARAGLRESFLQVHVDGPAPEPCRFTRERLAAHAGGGLRAAEAAEVDAHLAVCDACRDRFAEVLDLAGTLRHVGVPVALVLGLGSLSAAGLRGRGLHLALIARRAALGAGAAAAVVGLVLGIGVLSRGDPRPPVVLPAPTVAVATTVPDGPGPSSTTSTTMPSTTSTTLTTSTTSTTPARVAAVPTTRGVATSTSTTSTVRRGRGGDHDHRRCDRADPRRCGGRHWGD